MMPGLGNGRMEKINSLDLKFLNHFPSLGNPEGKLSEKLPREERLQYDKRVVSKLLCIVLQRLPEYI